MEEARRLVVGLELGRRRREAHDRQGQRRDEDDLVEALHRRRERAPEELVDRGPALEALVGLGELRRRRQDHGHAAPEVQGLPLLVVRARTRARRRRGAQGEGVRVALVARRRRRPLQHLHGRRVDDVLAADVDARVLGRRPHAAPHDERGREDEHDEGEVDHDQRAAEDAEGPQRRQRRVGVGEERRRATYRRDGHGRARGPVRGRQNLRQRPRRPAVHLGLPDVEEQEAVVRADARDDEEPQEVQHVELVDAEERPVEVDADRHRRQHLRHGHRRDDRAARVDDHAEVDEDQRPDGQERVVRHGLLDFDVVHVAVEPADARVRRRRALERREEVVLGPLAEGLAVREAEEDLGPRHVARRILDGEEDVEEVAALGRLRELGGRRGDGGRVTDHGAAREEGVGPAAHGGVRAPAVRAAGAAGDVAVVVEAVVARDAALEDARVQERLLGDDVVRPVPRRVEELQVLRVADGGEAPARRRAEAPLD